jgi:hypothetical protein
MQRRWWSLTWITVPVIVLALAGVAPHAGAVSAPRARPGRAASVSPVTQASRLTTGYQAGNPFCSRLGKQSQAPSAAQESRFGPQLPQATDAPQAVDDPPLLQNKIGQNLATFNHKDIGRAGKNIATPVRVERLKGTS